MATIACKSSKPNASVVPIVAIMAAIFLPLSKAARAASSSLREVDFVVGYSRNDDQLVGANAEPADDVVGAIVPSVGNEYHHVVGYALLHGPADRLFPEPIFTP